ncbi:MAG: NADH-quinone oxidoreductase subunit N [Planctomycetaceae bacterium]
MWQTFEILLPQIVLATLGCLLIVGGALPVASRRWGPVALVALGLAGVALIWSSSRPPADTSSLAVAQSALAIGFQWSCLVIGALFVVASLGAQADSPTAGEFYGLLLLMLAGLTLVGVADDLVLLFLSLELISIPTYVILYLGRRDYASQEAAIKYFLLSVLSGAILLYGFAFVYGLTGSTRLDAIQVILSETYQPPDAGLPPSGGSALGVLALVLIVAGLGFKMAAVPFHFYAPDVYEGTSAFNAGLLSVVPKAAGLVALIRVGAETLVGFETTGQQLLLILAAITMTGGNCLALLQTNIRRLLAYSSIAHAGYMLVGLAVGFWDRWNPQFTLDAATASHAMGLPGGIGASLLYLLAYSLTTVGLFAVLIWLARPGQQIDYLEELTGLGISHPLAAGITALFLFSLAGIPPLPGFWAKLSVFSAALSVRQELTPGSYAMHPAFVVLAIVGMLNAAIGAVYYLRLVAIMFLNDPVSAPRPGGGRPAFAAAALSAVLVVAMGLAPRPVFTFLETATTTSGSVARISNPGARGLVNRPAGGRSDLGIGTRQTSSR